MTEPRGSWFQRLVGADDGTLTALEQQLLKTQEQAQHLAGELARERQLSAQKDEELQRAQERETAAERDFEARLVALRQSSEARQIAHEELEQLHKNVSGELTITRNQLVRQRDEAARLTKSLAGASAQVERAEAAVQAARAQATDLEGKLAQQQKETQDARARLLEREKTNEAGAKELAEAKRKLQAAETRATGSERELAETKRALQTAEERLNGSAALLDSTRKERDFAVAVASDSWRALERVVGEAAHLALTLGVDTAGVEVRASWAEATTALQSTLTQSGRCSALDIALMEDGILLELKAPQLDERVAASRWLAAFTTCFLEKSLGIELGVESSSLEQDTLKLRLRSVPAG